MKNILIDPFLQGDWGWGLLFWFLFVIVLLFLLSGAVFLYEEFYLWPKQPVFKIPAKLLNINFEESTLQTHTVPVVTGKGMGVGTVTTGHAERHITIWDCGKYGRIVCEDEEVFRFAKNESILLAQEMNDEIRIVGLDRE